MKKYILGVFLVALVGGGYIWSVFSRDEDELEEMTTATLTKNFDEVTFLVSGVPITLVDGVATATTNLDGASETVVRYFGNVLEHDIDGDGAQDAVFLVTQETGGSGTFFYAVGALKRDEGYLGTSAVYIGDRIHPQTITPGDGREVVVNFAERLPTEPMAARPSMGRSLYLLLDTEKLEFGEVVKNFEGERR